MEIMRESSSLSPLSQVFYCFVFQHREALLGRRTSAQRIRKPIERLEAVSKPLPGQLTPANQPCSKNHETHMDLRVAFIAGPEPFKAMEPGDGPLNDPSMPSQPL